MPPVSVICVTGGVNAPVSVIGVTGGVSECE